jgi:endonuclease/exonuclease/phosphatase family metal-dependent hydrolase
MISNFVQRIAPFVLGTLLGLAPAVRAADAALRVMSFNVRNSNAKDGENAWPLRRDFLFAEIARYAPTLIGFQEVLADQHDAIVERMPEYAFLGVARDDGKRKGEWSMVGFRRDRFDNLGGGDFWLSESPEVVGSKSWDAALTRICTWVRLRDRVTKREFLFANTHFDHKGVQAREKSAGVIATRVRDLARGEPIILTGDLNITEDTGAYAVFAKPQGTNAAWLIDSYRETHPQRAPDEASFHAFKGTRTGSRIDFIFHSRELKAVESTIERNASPSGKFPSDHYAVTAVLVFL